MDKFIKSIGKERYSLATKPETLWDCILTVVNGAVTYYENGKIQCYCYKNRSLQDICRVALNYFPYIPVREIVSLIFSKLEDKKRVISYCNDIGRPVVFEWLAPGDWFRDRVYTKPTDEIMKEVVDFLLT